MSYLKLESVGTIVDKDAICYPMYKDGTPDLDNPCFIQDCENDEWWEKMSIDDALMLFPYLTKTPIYHLQGYFQWAVIKFGLVEEANNEYVDTAGLFGKGGVA